MKNDTNRSASMKKRFKKIYIIIPVLLAAAACIALTVLYLTGFFYNRKDIQMKADSAGQEIAVLAADTKVVPSDMLPRTVSLLSGKTGTSPYVVSWYALPGNISSVTALASEYLVTADQVNLLRCYIEKGDKDSARDLANAIEKDFTAGNGYLVPGRMITDLGSTPVFPAKAEYDELPVMSGYSMEATIGYVRALLEYYDKWGQYSDWTRIEKYAALLGAGDAVFAEDLTITVSTTPVPTGEGQDIVSIVGGQESDGGDFAALSLGALDLEVFRMLSSEDSKYQPLYDKALAILEGAMISSELPLYAVGYTQGSAGYVYYNGDKAQADLVSSLKVTLHLAEEGKAPQQTLLWIKEQLYNQGMLYQNYDLISGQPATSTESVESYGILLQIARAVSDADLYKMAMDRLEWHLATSAASSARSTIYRQLDSTRVVVYAKDNLEALLGV